MLENIMSSFAFTATLRLVLGFILAGIIGLERSSWNKPAGFRTHALVGISAVLVMLCGEYMSGKYEIDPSRIPAQLLSGIGFLGAGTILRNGANIKGLTTAASLLAVTCIGLVIGAGFYALGIAATVIVYIILSYSYLLFSKLDHFSIFELEIVIKNNSKDTINAIQKVLDDKSIIIKHMANIDNEKDKENNGNQKVIRISGKYSNKDEISINKIISEIVNIENIVKVEEIN